jgi:hypothetical protein
MFNIGKWLDQKLGVNVYELRDGKIYKDRGRSPSDIVEIKDITAWRVEYEMVFDVVTMRFSGGEELRWLDKHDDLLGILREKLKDKEEAEPAAGASRHRNGEAQR